MLNIEAVNIPFLLLLTIVFRVVISWKSKITFDGYGHLYMAQLIREQKSGIFQPITTNVVCAGKHSQPFLWHWMVSKFETNYIVKFHNWINVILDVIFLLITFVFVERIVGPIIAQAAIIAYLCTPILFSVESVGPRINTFTPRLSTEILSNTSSLFIIYGFHYDDGLIFTVILAALFAGGLIISKFGIQVTVIFTIIGTIILKSALPLLSFVLAFVFLWLLGKNHWLLILKNQYQHLIWYFKLNVENRTWASQRNKFDNFITAIKICDLKGIISFLFIQQSYTATLIKFSLAPILLIFILSDSLTGFDDNVNIKLVLFCLSVFFVFFIVNQKYFLHIGEAERYLTHSAMPLCICFVSYLDKYDLNYLIYFLVGYGLVYLTAEQALKFKLNHNSDTEDKKVIELLRNVNTSIVLCYPFGALGAWRVMMETDHKVLFPHTATDDFRNEFSRKYSDYPFVKLEFIDEIVEKYGVRYLIISKKNYLEKEKKIFKSKINHFNEIFSSEKYLVFEFPVH